MFLQLHGYAAERDSNIILIPPKEDQKRYELLKVIALTYVICDLEISSSHESTCLISGPRKNTSRKYRKLGFFESAFTFIQAIFIMQVTHKSN